MFLQHHSNGALVEILSMDTLFDPNQAKVMGRFHAGQEMQDAEYFTKAHLEFPSGEALPKCWLDAHYREHMKAN
ncbi:MAG: acetyltransferase [Synechococcus sp.]